MTPMDLQPPHCGRPVLSHLFHFAMADAATQYLVVRESLETRISTMQKSHNYISRDIYRADSNR
jgi:hypothetical protein